jgi:hypothetical protein
VPPLIQTPNTDSPFPPSLPSSPLLPSQRRRSRSLGGSSPAFFSSVDKGPSVLARLLGLLDDMLPPMPLDYHPLARPSPTADPTPPTQAPQARGKKQVLKWRLVQ